MGGVLIHKFFRLFLMLLGHRVPETLCAGKMDAPGSQIWFFRGFRQFETQYHRRRGGKILGGCVEFILQNTPKAILKDFGGCRGSRGVGVFCGCYVDQERPGQKFSVCGQCFKIRVGIFLEIKLENLCRIGSS